MTAKPRCACGRAAKFLCDELLPLGGPAARSEALARTLRGESITCDEPLCDRCRVYVGPTFFCGQGGAIDSQDRCQKHAPPPKLALVPAPTALVHGWEPGRQGFTCGATKRPAIGRVEVDRRAHPSSIGSPDFDLERDEQFCPECVRRLTTSSPAGAPAPAGGSTG